MWSVTFFQRTKCFPTFSILLPKLLSSTCPGQHIRNSQTWYGPKIYFYDPWIFFLNFCLGGGRFSLHTATAAGGFPTHHCPTWQIHSSTLLPGFCRHLICNLELVNFIGRDFDQKVLNGSALTLDYTSLLLLFSPNPPLLNPRKNVYLNYLLGTWAVW